jgi:hypothetical protein
MVLIGQTIKLTMPYNRGEPGPHIYLRLLKFTLHQSPNQLSKMEAKAKSIAEELKKRPENQSIESPWYTIAVSLCSSPTNPDMRLYRCQLWTWGVAGIFDGN